jgi:type VI secretion system protein ImpK
MSLAERAPQTDARSAPADVLYDATTDRRLADVLAPCFALIVHLRSHDAYGDPEALRQRVQDLLRQAEREADAAGIPPDHVENAFFAVVAFLDETILSSTWAQKDAWAHRPLQMERYDRFDAGEVFFHRLSSLLNHPVEHAEEVEVYYLCLTLGFRGRFQILQQEKLQEFIERCHDALQQTPGIQADVLSPDGEATDPVAAEVSRTLPGWMLAVAGMALALLLYAGFSLYISQSAQESAQTIEQMIAPPLPE